MGRPSALARATIQVIFVQELQPAQKFGHTVARFKPHFLEYLQILAIAIKVLISGDMEIWLR